MRRKRYDKTAMTLPCIIIKFIKNLLTTVNFENENELTNINVVGL